MNRNDDHDNGRHHDSSGSGDNGRSKDNGGSCGGGDAHGFEVDLARNHIYRIHGSTVSRLRVRAASDAGTSEGRHELGGRPARAVFPSIADPDVQVRIVATNIPLELLPQFTGNYPHLSRLMIVTVAARDTRSRKTVDLPGVEADAWATALAPEGFGAFVIRIGVMTGSTGRAVHYRYVIGPDLHICAVDEHDTARMHSGYHR